MHVKLGKCRLNNHPATSGNRNLWAFKIPKEREFVAQNPARPPQNGHA